MSGILIIGAGGHAKVLADALLSRGERVLGFVDDNAQLWGQSRLGLPILGGIDSYTTFQPDGLLLGIGVNSVRKAIVERLGEAARPLWRTAIHPSAVIAASASIGPGTAICAGVVVNPDTVIGQHAIINTGATVDHDCLIEDYAHIAPGSTLTGSIRVGAGALIGARTVTIPGRTIGAWATVGAGAVITRDIPPGVTAKGIPARWTT